MNQQVADTKYRIARLIANAYRDYGSVLFHKYAVQSERDCHPLVFLDAAIVMRIKHSHLCIFIQGHLL